MLFLQIWLSFSNLQILLRKVYSFRNYTKVVNTHQIIQFLLSDLSYIDL